MEIKTKLAALLHRWAYAIHPETPATLPPGYELTKVVCFHTVTPQDGRLQTTEEVKDIRQNLTKRVLNLIERYGYIQHHVDIAPVPGGLIDYEATLYVGYIPRKRTK